MQAFQAFLSTAIQGVWSVVLNILPVHKWVRVAGNVLRQQSLALILLVIVFLIVLAGDWGFSQDHRFILAILVLALILVVLLIVGLLAATSADSLYSPYERSLARGNRYGTKAAPTSKRVLELTEATTHHPGLPAPSAETDNPQLGP